MYRIFCQSYDNYISQFPININNEYRFNIAKPLRLLKNIYEYRNAKENNTLEYKKISDLLYYMKSFPELKAFLWTLESRGIKGQYFGIVPKKDLDEQVKLINMFLSLLYWDEGK